MSDGPDVAVERRDNRPGEHGLDEDAQSPELRSEGGGGHALEAQDTAIFDIAYECFNAFENIRVTQNEALTTMPFIPGEVPKRKSKSSIQKTRRDFLGLRNSFVLWVDYTGALSLMEASLDARLRGLADISSMVVELLDMVLRNLRRLEDTDDKMRVDNDYSGSPVEDRMRIDGETPTDTMRQLSLSSIISRREDVLRAVDSALDRLHFLATAIRKASAKRLEYNVGSFLMDEDVLFRRDAVSLVKWKFPHARRALCEQLGNSIAIRRRILLRKNRHAKKLTVRRTLEPAMLTQKQQSIQPSPQTVEHRVGERTPRHLNVPSTAATWTSKPDPEAKVLRHIFTSQRLALSSVTSSALSVAGDSFEYPDPPKAKESDKHTQCPYCLKPLETAKLRKQNNEYWRRHLDEDLQPYVCLFPECAEALVFFTRRREWKSHMEEDHSKDWARNVHSITWYCNMDHDPPAQFETALAWREHMRDLNAHGQRRLKRPTEAQLDALSANKQQLVLRDRYVCPLCEQIPEKIRPIVERGNPVELSQSLSNHVANHIKSLSLMSLPCPDEGAAEVEVESIQFKGSLKRRRNEGSDPRPPSGVENVDFDDSLSFHSSMSTEDLPSSHDIEYPDYYPPEPPPEQEDLDWVQSWKEWKEESDGVAEKSDEVDLVIQEITQIYLAKQKLELQIQPCRYKTGKTLGAGSYSVVKECIHIDTGRYYAAKVINKRLTAGMEDLIRNEIVVLKTVSMGHVNIMTMVDYFETVNNLYIVLELALGGTLSDRIRRKGSYYESDAITIIQPILSAVSYLHDYDIVHCNLTAENILFKTPEDDAQVVVSGFSNSRKLDKHYETGVLIATVGTPQYMSPEILKGTGHGKPVDIWALGAITYFLLCGHMPFDHETEFQGVQAIINADYSFTPLEYWKSVSDTAKDFIHGCLRLDPNQRMTAHEALLHPWLHVSVSDFEEGENLLPLRRKHFNPRRTLIAAIHVVRAINILRKRSASLRANDREPHSLPLWTERTSRKPNFRELVGRSE